MNGLQATAESRADRNNIAHCKSECSNSSVSVLYSH